jgi:hypothetical protein
MEQDENIVDSFNETIWRSGLSEFFEETTEIAIDSFIKNGLAKELPIVKYVVSGIDIVRSIRERSFLKKILLFLSELRSIDIEARKEFGKQLDANPKFKRKVGNDVIMLLEKHENYEKSTILGKIFRAYIRNDITYSMFLRMAYIIDISFFADIVQLPKIYADLEKLDEDSCENLYRVGLVNLSHGIGGLDFGKEPAGYTVKKYTANEIGKKMISLLS